MASFFKLSSMKQPIVEKFYGIPERQFFSGKECIHIYKQFQKTKDSSLSALLFGHNQEDLSGLIQLTSLLSYRSLYDGIFHLADSYYEGGEYIATITLPFFLPVPVSNGNKYFYLTCQERKARILIPAVKDKLRFYHADYKKYAYLPEEDTVIPKSLSKFLDRSLFLSATPETCYTWVSCEDLFLSDALKQEQFIKQQLPILLSFL